MYNNPFSLLSSYPGHYDETWDDHYLVLDTLGCHFLANFAQCETSFPGNWPKLERALQKMPLGLFWDLCGDVHEEIYRRNNELRDGMFSLPPGAEMPLGRIHVRKRLSAMQSDRFHALSLHVSFEAGKRCSRNQPERMAMHHSMKSEQISLSFADSFNLTPMKFTDSNFLWESLGNLPPARSRPRDHGLNLPDTSHDYFTQAMSAAFSVITSILQNHKRYFDLLSCREQRAQEVLDIMQMLLDYPPVGGATKTDLLSALTRLSVASGLHPQRFLLTGIKKEELVTNGSFSDIWKGRLRDQVVCLKVVRTYQETGKVTMLKSYSREAILWGHLSHPNILPFYGVYHLEDEDRRICLISPWMENGNINEYLRMMPAAPRALLASDIASGLQYLHQQNIVHGDLKGPNILVSNSGRACLADFGLSTLLGPTALFQNCSDSAHTMGGTIRWQAPELLNPEIEHPKPNVQSDIYSYGCVLYEIFVGKYPFYEYSRDVTVILRIMEGKKPSIPDPDSAPYFDWGLTGELCTIMEECWSAGPDRRPNAYDILSRLGTENSIDLRPMNCWQNHSPSEFRNAIYRNDQLSLNTLDTVLSWASY